MARLTLVKTEQRANTNLAHRASVSEGEAAKRLLEDQGYVIKRKANGQYELRCPFHEGPGAIESRKGTNFYLNADSSLYTCHSAGCGERGNLQTLERYFGVGEDDSFAVQYRDRDTRLKDFERNLTTALRAPFYEHGLTDATIERFRLGYEPEHDEVKGERTVHIPGRYVIPYLENRRPKFFRYYQPTGDPKWKYTWEENAEGSLFNVQDAFGDADGQVFICEGEQKAMLLVQMGYAAVAVPGASMWKDEFQAAFTHARKILVCYDNDNPAFHNYDKPEESKRCPKCAGKGLDRCTGHNPGQEAALARVEQLGWRAKNIVLPLPDESYRKTDINDYFMRDGHSNPEFAQLATGKNATPFKVMSFAEITASPPDEATFLIDQGILPAGGRLLIAGKPKVGKSIFVDNLALSLAAGIPFLGKFEIKPGCTDLARKGARVLLLDRELSKWSLFKRLTSLTEDRPGYKAAMDNLLIDHDHLIRLDQNDAYETLLSLVEENGAEVVILDTAYKFLGDMESSSALKKAFDVLDKVLHKTGCSFVLTHHHKKSQSSGGKTNTDVADPDNVAGSFLWTGWPNATILLNYLNRSVENPFNSVATFTAFRDAAPPEPLALHRTRESISYSAVLPYQHESDDAAQGGNGGGYGHPRPQVVAPTTDAVEQLLLECVPTTEDDFMHIIAGKFGLSQQVLRMYYIDAMSRGNFVKTSGKPPIIKFKHQPEEEQESWEKEHGLPERPMPEDLALDEGIFDAAALGPVES